MPDNFYATLPAYTNFSEAMDLTRYTPVPDDWYVIISDIKGSTQAVQNGRYKEVNMLGASCIVAVLNVASELEIPFVFGGDGATVLVPPSLLEAAKSALLATQEMAQEAFGMTLRVGLAPVATANKAGKPVVIAKFRPSPNYEQAMFAGGGLAYIEKLIKDPETAVSYNLQVGETAPSGDFTGLECRWQDIPSQYGETISLLVMALSPDSAQDSRTYQSVLQTIETVFGSPSRYQPVVFDNLKATFNPRQLLAGEIRVRSPRDAWSRFKYLLKLWFASAFYVVATRFDLTTNDVRWLDYQSMVVATSDFRKYDDTLRMVVAGTAEQRQQLTDYLETHYQAGDLVYGIHVTDRALLTCLVFERMGRQVHFVDGADGGYALAAKELKRRLQEIGW